ncbi:MAG: Calx-beta domain-containing protein [Planctomycetaceae bacterium]
MNQRTSRTHRRSRTASRRPQALGFERCEPRHLLAIDTGHMAVGMNLESVVDWSPAWTFTDAFKASRPWISHAFNPDTWGTTWDASQAPTLDLDANGNVRSLKTWTQNGVQMRQFAGTLMFNSLGGAYAGGTYRAEWDGTGVVTFGFDAVVTASGRTAAGRNFADLRVTPTDSGIYMRIEQTSPTDPVRGFNVWMPDWNGHSFVGERWQPGAAVSPCHPLFLDRLGPFKTLRFRGMRETNTSDIATWSQRRDAADIRQGSGAEGTPSEPVANGISLEYMVELANELDADPWFNMPHLADDTFVRNFATYVRDHLEPGRTAYVEWANEVWNFGWGFEASEWVKQRWLAEGLDPDYGQWIVTAREAKRDFDIWSSVFTGQTDRIVRVAAGQAANAWIVEQITANMGGAYDAIALAPYITYTDEQRATYTSATTVDRILADAWTNVATSIQWTRDHAALAARLSTQQGRPIQLVAYEGGPHLDGRGASYQNAFYDATNDPRMGDVYRAYLRGLDDAGLDLYVDFQFTGQAGAAPWGDFAKLHRMDEPLSTAWKYAAVAAAADGSLWGVAPPLAPAVVTVAAVDSAAAEAGLDPGTIRFTRTGGSLTASLTVTYAVGGSATPGADYRALAGTVTFAAGATTADVVVRPLDDTASEPVETVIVTAVAGSGYTLGTAKEGRVSITSDDPPPLPVVSVLPARISEGNSGIRRLSFTIALSATSTQTVSVRWATSNGTAAAGRDYYATSGAVSFAPGQRTATVGVWVIGDRTVEADETFFVALSSPTRATLSPTAARAAGTIVNDDGLQQLAAFAALGSSGTTTKKK